MSNRDYNKLFVHKNRENDSEQIILGYQDSKKEIKLAVDEETYFHIPPFTKSLKISESNLIESGATPGPFPAAADKIFKNLEGFGNVTSNGTPSEIAEGGWYCSWLYKDGQGDPKWMDRFYNPGQLNLSTASRDLTSGPIYSKHNPVFYDVPSSMMLEAGVKYKYVHVGEKNAQQIVNSFGGINQEHLLLNLNGWGTPKVDNGPFEMEVKINTLTNSSALYKSYIKFSDNVNSSFINLDQTTLVDVFIEFNEKLIDYNQFSVVFWAYNKNWNNANSTQLVGNFSSKGGYGVFIENINDYPFFVIPEINSGHILYINNHLEPFLDKKLYALQSFNAFPYLVCVGRENTVFTVCSSTDGITFLGKYDHTGSVLSKVFLDTEIAGKPFKYQQLLLGPNDQLILIDPYQIKTFDLNLNLISGVARIKEDVPSFASFSFNSQTNNYKLVFTPRAIDCKFVGETGFSINYNNFNLYKNGIVFKEFKQKERKASCLAVDPLNRLWVSHGENFVSILDVNGKTITKFNLADPPNFAKKRIDFIQLENPVTFTKEWRALIYSTEKFVSGDIPKLHVYDLDGILIQQIDLFTLFNSYYANVLNEKFYAFNFTANGDFTGYEHKRIFNIFSPFNNENQLVIKVSLKNEKEENQQYLTFQSKTSINKLNLTDWQHFALIYENKLFKLYINGKLILTLFHSPEYKFYYESQPSFYIGSSMGTKRSFNSEIKSHYSQFRGIIKDVRIYNYSLNPTQLLFFVKANIKSQPIFWQYPTPTLEYIEKVEKIFKNKLPGSKSSFFNLKIKGVSHLTDTDRLELEHQIKTLSQTLVPPHAILAKITWIK